MPEVAHWVSSPPFPYLLEHAEAWLTHAKADSDRILSLLDQAKDSENLFYADGCPVRTIREVKEDGTEIILGDVGLMRCPYGEIMGPDGEVSWDKKQLREGENNRLGAGDPGIVWSFGYYLDPSHHRRGIMSDAVATVLNDWAIPRMNVHHILVNVFEGNDGSMRTLQKNGFAHTRTIPEHIERRGVKRTIHVLEWSISP
ncbi:hypothetical protein AX16_000314 [Volvariella volvacea WC 439]|nr:hypothetical protein AX16_000314 [Volvariella volvacea WC 439]